MGCTNSKPIHSRKNYSNSKSISFEDDPYDRLAPHYSSKHHQPHVKIVKPRPDHGGRKSKGPQIEDDDNDDDDDDDHPWQYFAERDRPHLTAQRHRHTRRKDSSEAKRLRRAESREAEEERERYEWGYGYEPHQRGGRSNKKQVSRPEDIDVVDVQRLTVQRCSAPAREPDLVLVEERTTASR